MFPARIKKGKNIMDKLIKEAKGGDPDAFARLMRSQMQSMYKTAGAILFNDEDVADAISDTILACWENLSGLKNNRFFKTWMTRILVNKCSDIIRRKKYFIGDELPDMPYTESGYENAEWKEAIGQIPEKYRLVMLLYHIEGFSTGDIGEILDIPEGTVRSRLARGREYLAREYAKKGGQTL